MNGISNSQAADLEELEYQLDCAIGRLAAIETANEERIPWDMHKRLMAGEVPVKVWREHRGLLLADLARQAGIAEPLLADYEAEGAEPGLRQMSRIAKALGVEVDLLVPVEQDAIAAE